MSGPGGKEVGRLALKVVPDTDGFGAELQAFAERIEESVRIELPVSLDETGVMDDVARIKAMLGGEELDLGLDLDVEEGRRELAGTVEELDLMADAADVVIYPEVDGSTARLQMRSLIAELHLMAAGADPTIDIDVDMASTIAGIGAANAATQTFGGSSSFVGGQIALWGPLIFAAAAGIMALAPALLVILPLVGGLAAAAGVVALGWEQVKDVLAPIGDAFGEIRAQIGGILTEGIAPLVGAFVSQLMPTLTSGFSAIAGVLNGAAKSLLGFLTSAEGIELVGQFFDGLATALQPFGQLLGPVAEVFLRLSIAAMPALQMMGDAILRVTEGLAEWLTANDITAQISESMSTLGVFLQEVGALAAGLFGPLFESAPGIIALLSGVGGGLVAVLDVLSPFFTFMSENTGLMKVFGFVLGGLALVFGVMAVSMAVVAAAGSGMALAIGAAVGVIVGALLYAYTQWDWFRAIVNWVVNSVIGYMRFFWGIVAAVFRAVVAAVRAAVPVWNVIRAAVQVAISVVVSVVQRMLGIVRTIAGVVSGAAGGAVAAFGRMRSGFAAVVTAVVGKIRDLIARVREIPGKASAALGNLGSYLSGKGAALIQGLINGITSKIDDIAGAMGKVAGKIKGFLPGSPVKWGPLTAWNDGSPGKHLMGFIADGISADTSVDAALADVAAGIASTAFNPSVAWTGAGAALFDGGAVDVQAGAFEIRIANWDSGRGVLRQEAESMQAQQSLMTEHRQLMGVSS